MLDRSAVNCSPLPLGEEHLGGGRLAAFTEPSALCFERRLSASVFLLPPALPLANSAATFFLASAVFASQVAAPIVIALPAISAVQPSFHQSFQDRPGKPRFPPAWRVALIEALCFACLPFHPRMN